jgi:hypothetical protein
LPVKYTVETFHSHFDSLKFSVIQLFKTATFEENGRDGSQLATLLSKKGQNLVKYFFMQLNIKLYGIPTRFLLSILLICKPNVRLRLWHI